MTTTYTVKVNDWKGTKEWYLDGKLHRIDGPAYEDVDGSKFWYVDDKLHRVDGPAIECADGTKLWYLNDKRHRVDGPAAEWADGTKLWYLDGKELTESQWIEAVKPKVASCVGKMVEVDGVKYRLIAA
jgi:hypothetical protein